MGRKALTTEEWIREARETHGEKYDYSKSVYIKRDQKLIIICPIHGEFEQHAGSHIVGRGCRECYVSSKRPLTEDFIAKSKLLYGDRFTYNKTEYINAHADLIVTCTKHGDKIMRARKHLQKHGCPECAIESVRSNTAEFIAKATTVHDTKYNYDKVDYFKNDTPITIICNTCSIPFNMKPNTHLRGSGCPRCAKTGFNTGSPISYFYIIRICGQETFTGFGITSVLTGRFKTHRYNLRDANCYVSGAVLLVQSTGENIYNLEKYIKTIYNCKQSQVSGFKTESVREVSSQQLLKICIDWLSKEDVEYEVLTHYIGIENDSDKCCTSGNTLQTTPLCGVS